MENLQKVAEINYRSTSFILCTPNVLISNDMSIWVFYYSYKKLKNEIIREYFIEPTMK